MGPRSTVRDLQHSVLGWLERKTPIFSMLVMSKNAVGGSIAGVALLMLTNIGTFPKLAMNVGPVAQPVLQFDGGDGTMPWEWLMPSSAAGISAALYQHTEIALWRFGNAWVLCESAGVIALVCLCMFRRVAPPFEFSNVYDDCRRRFGLCGIALARQRCSASGAGSAL